MDVFGGFGVVIVTAVAVEVMARPAGPSFDSAAVVNILTAVGGVATAVLAATSKRRDARAGQLADLVKERNALRDRYDAAVGYLYALRRMMRERDIDPPPVPDEVRDE